MWLRDAEQQEAVQHERQVRSMTRMMLPMMDVASLVERMPEADRRRAAEYERLAQAMAEHEVGAGERSPGVMTRFAAWVEAYVAGLFRQRESSEAVGR
ncbi:MAG TPA: hypothetical protein VFU22_25940 [Roseiflexaceae bacterium]|nr:hypothetical protein [Roseiflexaceae bacterium]